MMPQLSFESLRRYERPWYQEPTDEISLDDVDDECLAPRLRSCIMFSGSSVVVVEEEEDEDDEDEEVVELAEDNEVDEEIHE